MRLVATLSAAALCLSLSSTAEADPLISGPQVGDQNVGVFRFSSVKCGGASGRYSVGAKPTYYWDFRGVVIVVFARTFDDKLASLVKLIDKHLQRNGKQKNGCHVNFLGNDRDRTEAQAITFGKKHKLAKIVLAVPVAIKQVPKRLRISSDAEVTVIIYELEPGRVVKANHAIGKGGLDRKATNAILADVEKHLR